MDFYLRIIHRYKIPIRMIASMALTKVETISFLENSFLDLQRLDLYKFVRLPIGSKMVEDMSWLKLADIEPEILTTRDFWLDGPKTRSGMEDVTRGEERRSTVFGEKTVSQY